MSNEHRKVAFLGPRGTFTEEAAHYFFPQIEAEWIPEATIPDVLDAVDSEIVDWGVVPVENSLEGAVNVTWDWLAHEVDLHITAEAIMPIRQQLVAIPGVEASDLNQIWSHPQALAQCRNFLRTLPNVTLHSWDSTAAAAAAVAEQRRSDVAAIATEFAAKDFGLQVLRSNIQDSNDNFTRFAVVSKKPIFPVEADHSILLVTLNKDRPGALVHVLNIFAAVGLNLTRIESRPTRKTIGSYHFFIDLNAPAGSRPLEQASLMIGTLGHQVRLLGSYQKDEKNRKTPIDKG